MFQMKDAPMEIETADTATVKEFFWTYVAYPKRKDWDAFFERLCQHDGGKGFVVRVPTTETVKLFSMRIRTNAANRNLRVKVQSLYGPGLTVEKLFVRRIA